MDNLRADSRYKERLKFQRALTDVIVVWQRNSKAKIAPDETTALMAAQVIRTLARFCEEAGVATWEVKPDPSRFQKLAGDREKERVYRRRLRRARQKRTPAH
jgi:hypothetical protein